MSTFSSTLAITKRLRQLGGPAVNPSPDVSPAPASSIPPLELPSPRDLQGPLSQLGLSPPLASLISRSYQDHARKTGQAVLPAHRQYARALDEVTSRIGPALDPQERAAFASGHDASIGSIFSRRYFSHLAHVEKVIFDLVAARRAQESQSRQPRQVPRKGFAKKAVEILRKIYLVESYPNIAELRVISEHIRMDYKQTRVWFQNRRNRKKRSKRGIHEDARIAKLSGLPSPNPGRVTKRTNQQRKEDIVMRTSMSPKLVRKTVLEQQRSRKGKQPQHARRPPQMDPYALQHHEMGLVPMGAEWDDEQDVEMDGYAGMKPEMDKFQGFSFGDLQPPPSAPHLQVGYTQLVQPSPYPSHSYSGGNGYLAPPQHPISRSTSWRGPHPSPASTVPSPIRYSYSAPATPQPLIQNSPPSCSDAELEAFFGIVSTDPPSSYQGFATAPVVASNLSFIPPPPCDFSFSPTPNPADLSDPFALVPEPEFYAPLLPTMDSNTHSSPITDLSPQQQWSDALVAPAPEPVEPEVEQDWSQLLLASPSATDGAIPGAVDNYLPLDFDGAAFNEVWDQYESLNGGMSFVVPEAAGTW